MGKGLKVLVMGHGKRPYRPATAAATIRLGDRLLAHAKRRRFRQQRRDALACPGRRAELEAVQPPGDVSEGVGGIFPFDGVSGGDVWGRVSFLWFGRGGGVWGGAVVVLGEME